MLPKIGFPPHLARHLIFLTEDTLQVVTFDSKAEELIKALESVLITIIKACLREEFGFRFDICNTLKKSTLQNLAERGKTADIKFT